MSNQWGPNSPSQPPRRWTPGTILLWVIAVGLCVALIPLLVISARMQDEATNLQATLTAVQQSMTVVPTPALDVQQLATALAQAQDQAGQIQVVYPTLVAPRPDWRAVMAAINNYDPNQIALSSLTQTGSQIEISGRAVNDTAVAAYSQRLEASGRFARVVIQSMRVVPAPTATATPTPTPTSAPTVTATPSPTPSLTPDARDAFEPDDALPRPIFLGQPQVHTFFPNGDTDTVTFLAKAGRTYRIYTTDLAPGVDTVLAVIAGSLTYTNDDVSAGTLRSEVVFQAGNADTNVVARVTNRDAFGSDKRYTLAVEEIVLTPTPTSSPTPTETPTATPTTSAMRARRAPGVAMLRVNQSFTVEFTLLVEVKVVAP